MALLVFAQNASAQTSDTILRNKERDVLPVASNAQPPDPSVPNAPLSTPTDLSGAGNTGFVSQKKRAPKKKQERTALTKSAPPSPPPQSVLLAIRNPALRRTQQQPPASPEITGALAPRLRRVQPDSEPFGPVGFYSGAFLLRPSIELQSGYDTNAQKVVGGRGSWFEVVQGQVQGKSDWQRHELSFDLRGAYTTFNNVDGLDRPDVLGVVRGRIDVSSLSRIETESKFALDTQYPGSPDAIAAVRRMPLIYSFGQTAAWVQQFNRFEVTAGVGIERNLYENAELTNGAFFDLSDRDYTAYSTRLRGAYEWSPDVKPFAEVSFDRRERDLPVDFNGIMRDSDGYTLRAGVTFGRKEWLYGDVSAGYAHRSYADPILQDVSGMIFDASLVWLATGLTTVKLNASSGIDETSVFGASGVLRRDANLVVEHAFRRWLVGSAGIGFLREEYEGAGLVNDYLRISAALTYSLNRSLALKTEYRNERFFSNVPGIDYTANIGLIGIRLQR